jgi:PhnB protein
MHVTPYLSFNGRTEEAIEFYKAKLGAQQDMLMRFNETPDPMPEGMVPPGSERKVMHASFRIGSTTIMASDGDCSGHTNFAGVTLSLAVDSIPEAEKAFNALADGGQVQNPLMETFFAHRWGMVVDRFGVSWMVIVMKSM